MCKLLFIDDDYASHVYHREMAESAGFHSDKLIFFFDVNAALEHMRVLFTDNKSEDWPNYIFVDLNMPEKSGYDFLDELKEEYDADIIPPIYLVSTTKNQEDVNKVEQEPLIKGFRTKFLEEDFFETLLTKPETLDSDPPT